MGNQAFMPVAEGRVVAEEHSWDREATTVALEGFNAAEDAHAIAEDRQEAVCSNIRSAPGSVLLLAARRSCHHTPAGQAVSGRSLQAAPDPCSHSRQTPGPPPHGYQSRN